MSQHSQSSPRVFLIDALSFIFRAYHAMSRQRPMSTRTGVPTAATYVFVNMLRKLRADFSPEYIAAIFDVSGPTFRDVKAESFATVSKFDIKTQSFKQQAYGGYKAQRAAMPEDLAQQLPYIRRALEAYCIPIIEAQGYEADDVLGTLAMKASLKHPVYVVSNDKDMLQLVGKNIYVLNPPKDNLIFDAAKVEETLGVRPDQVVDVMALRGDAVDNIPGAPGVGDKGSVDIIQRFSTLERALERAAEIEKKTYRESLLQHSEQILYSKQQVTLDCNVPLVLDLDAMRSREPDLEACRTLFSELEFTSLLAELAAPATGPQIETREHILNSAHDLENFLSAAVAPAVLALAIESASTSGANADDEDEEKDAEILPLAPAAANELHALKLAMCLQPGEAAQMQLEATDGASNSLQEKLRETLAGASIPKAVHNFQSAQRVLHNFGVQLAGVAHDPQLYSYLLNPTDTSHGLEAAALRAFGHKPSGALLEAADLTLRLSQRLRPEIEQAGLLKLYEEMDLPLAPVLARMELAGVKLDAKVLGKMSERLERESKSKAAGIYELAGSEFNINSPKQLGDILFNKLNLPMPSKRGKGKAISTAVDVLEELSAAHDVPRLVLEFRQLSKLKSTYVDALPALIHPATGRLHTTFNATATATGRLSSVNPNLQNIPIRSELGREIRAAFIAEPGNLLLSADYSQIELRLLAHFSEDELLVEAFRRGDDIHTLTATQVFGVPPLMIDAEHRRRAKAVNFGIVYGLSPFGLAQQIGIEQREAKKFIEAYFERYKGVRAFIDRTLEAARREQRVRTLFGRVRPIPDIHSKNPTLRGFAERTAVNTPLQGTAADLIKLAMIRIDRELAQRKLRSRMTLQVHDELVFEIPEAEADTMRTLVREHMESVCKLAVPLVVEIGVGKNWRDME